MKIFKQKLLSIFIVLAMVLSLCATAALAAPAGEDAAAESAGESGEDAAESDGESGEDAAAESDGESAGEAGEDAAQAAAPEAVEDTGESDGESSGESDGESDGESAGMGQEFGTYDEIAAAAGIIIENGEVSYAEGWDGTVSGDITAEGMKGAVITANEANGAAITLAAETDTYVIEDSEISVTSGQKNNDLGYEAAFGVGIGIKTGELWIKNSKISSEGPRSTAIYGLSTDQPEATSLVVVDSEITSNTSLEDVWMPPFKLLAGGSRATLLMTRNNSWFINSRVASKTWGAISQDTIEANTYMVNAQGLTTEGGYAPYLTWNLYMYASQLYGAQYGAFQSGQSLIITGSAEDALADADAMSRTPDYVPEDQPTVIAAGCNAIVVHNAFIGADKIAVANFKNATLSTMHEDLPEEVTPMAANSAFLLNPDMDDFGISSGTAYFYTRNLYGSLILVRSMNSDYTFDNTVARPANGVLMQTVLNYDPPQSGGYAAVGEGEALPGSKITFLNGEYTGDILHEDYQRAMAVIVGENAVLNGAIVSFTYQGWNDLWTKDALMAMLQADGYDGIPFASEDWVSAVQENLILADDVAYAETENIGVDVTVAAGGTWVVTGTSTLSSLTIEEGAAVAAPEGMTLTVFADADATNANSTYEGGTQVDDLAAGTYANVIITVS